VAKHILLVDDDDGFRRLCERVLTGAGHTVDTAPSAAEALSMFGKVTYDIVITDIVMPDMDGIELIKALRGVSHKFKIVAMSGGSERLPANSGLRLSRAMGVDAILYKPFRPNELTATLESL
jgi:DNA-binding response OmpR family regulator